jgi:hypothetical protein
LLLMSSVRVDGAISSVVVLMCAAVHWIPTVVVR